MTVTLDLDAAQRDPSTRRALDDLSLIVAKCKKVVVVTGAGISCSSGIPDFRSSDGLYNLVKQRYPNVVLKGRDLFDASLFRDTTTTSVFYTFISQLKQSIDSATPTPTHHFLKTLDSKNKLLRSYTQNIDGLEARAGLLSSSSQEAKATSSRSKSKINMKDVRNVQLHGDIHRVRCTACSANYAYTSEHLHIFNEGLSPPCPDCVQRSEARVARSARATKVGGLRPAIVLYDEPHPLGDDIGMIQGLDVNRKPDMLLIMGTSLKVHGLKKLVKEFAKAVHTHSSGTSTSNGKSKKAAGRVVFVNKTAPGGEWSDIIDYHVSGETDAWVSRVEEDWRKRRPQDWEVQTTLDGDINMLSPMKVVKPCCGVINPKPKDLRKIHDEENVPPAPLLAMLLSTPDWSKSAVKAQPVVSPGSPTKRRQGGSHYNDLESSPSKRRTHHGEEVAEEFEGRGLLFVDNKNHVSQPNVFDDELGAKVDVVMLSPVRPQSKKVAPPRSKSMKKNQLATEVHTRPSRLRMQKVEVAIG